jgi:hypothetical protein
MAESDFMGSEWHDGLRYHEMAHDLAAPMPGERKRLMNLPVPAVAIVQLKLRHC